MKPCCVFLAIWAYFCPISSETDHLESLLWKSEPDAVYVTKCLGLVLVYESPCKYLLDPQMVPQDLAENFSVWCEVNTIKQFEESYRQLCSSDHKEAHGADHSLPRDKIIFRESSSSVIVSQVLPFEPNQVERVDHKSLEPGEEIDVIRKLVPLMTPGVSNVSEQLHSLEVPQKEIDVWKRERGSESEYIATLKLDWARKVASEFYAYKGSNFSNEWKAGEVDLRGSPFETFFLDNYDLEKARPKHCQFNESQRLVSFEFEVRKKRTNVTLLEARVVSPLIDDKPHKECRFEYKGPQRVLFDADSNCFVDRLSSPLPITLSLKNCTAIPGEDTLNTYWDEVCEDVHRLQEDKTGIHLKTVQELHYIQCMGFHIQFLDKTFPCPNYVFTLRKGVAFKLTTEHVDLQQKGKERLINVDFEFSQKANQVLNKRLKGLNFVVLPLTSSPSDHRLPAKSCSAFAVILVILVIN